MDIQNQLFMTDQPNSDGDQEMRDIDNDEEDVDMQDIEQDECKSLFQTAKPFNATIKHASAKQFSTHLNNMYAKGTIYKKALGRLLKVLLKLHFQPAKERKRRKTIDELKRLSENQDRQAKPYVLTRNKKRSLLRRYRKKFNKYQVKQYEKGIEMMSRMISYTKACTHTKKIIHNANILESHF
jgi:hypothetical protein